MIRFILVAALVLGSLSSLPVVAAGEPEPCSAVPPASFCAVVAAVEGHVENAAENVTRVVDAIGDQPGVFVVDETSDFLCRVPENVQCRAISGRPFVAGQLEMCSTRRVGVFGVMWDGFQVANTIVAHATTTFAAGTAAEGEHLCHDHRPTLRALATLP